MFAKPFVWNIFLLVILSLCVVSCNIYLTEDDKIQNIPQENNLWLEGSRQFLNDAVYNHSDRAEVLYKKAIFHLKNQEDTSALQAIQKAIGLDNINKKHYFVLGQCFKKLRKYDKALVAYLTALDNRTINLDLNLSIAELYLLKKRYNKALEYLNGAEKITQLDERIYYLKGNLALDKLDSANAIYNLKKATEQKPDYIEAYISLAKLYNIFELHQTAIRYANKGLKFANTHDILNFHKAESFRLMRFYEDSAKFYYLKAYQANPELYWASYHIGLYYFKLGDIQEANKYFLAAIKQNENFMQGVYYAGVTYAYLGKNEQAIKYLEKTVKAEPFNYAARDLYWGVRNQLELVKIQKQADSLQKTYYEQQEKILKQLQQQTDSSKK